MESVFTICLLSYLIGSINGAHIIGKLKNVNLKKEGVKNAGASNTLMVLGLKYGVIVAMIDILKPIFVIFLIQSLLSPQASSIILLAGLFVILGHNHSIFMSFQGGKGTASFIGLTFMVDWKIGFISLIVLLTVALVSNFVVVGVFSMYLTFILLLFISGGDAWSTAIALLMFFVAIVKHLENVKRILQKSEPKLKQVLFKKDKS